MLVLCIFLLSSTALSQAGAAQEKNTTQAIEGLRKLHANYNEAASKRDRTALERLFAEGYVWVHGNGSVITKAKLIENVLGNTQRCWNCSRGGAANKGMEPTAQKMRRGSSAGR